MDSQVSAIKACRTAHYYHLLQVDSVIGACNSVLAHLNGGAMASTTDWLSCLWHVVNIPRGSVTLAVTDNHWHFPGKLGYL